MVETLGTRIANRRKQLGKTLAEIAKAAGMSPGFLSDLEHDRSKGTTKLNGLAATLGLHIDYLEHGKGPPLGSTPSPAYAIKALVSNYRAHGYDLTEEACEFAHEWDKLQEPVRTQILIMVESLVAAQVRKKRRAERSKSSKERHEDAN